jgi:hypothetical protein
MDASIKLALTRALVYLATLGAGSAAAALAATGYATYDPATGLLDFHPIDIKAAVGAFGIWIGGGGLAFLAVIRGWGKKKIAPS